MIQIPKILGHIWVGHLPAPTEWLDTWKKFHPEWEYRLYDNEFLFSRRWRNQDLINAFYNRKEYAGVSDLMRYEILHEIGGFIPEADSICQKNTDELWTEDALYSVYENEVNKPGLISPFLASTPNHKYLDYIQRRVRRRNHVDKLAAAWKSVGNRFLAHALKSSPPGEDHKVIIFPSHYFIPRHKKFERYSGDGPVYCDQLWGSTFGNYKVDPTVDVKTVHTDHMKRLEKRLEK